MAFSLTSEQTRLVGDAARELDAAGPCTGERGVIVKRLASALGISVNTAYQYLRKYAGWTSGKKPRRGKGETCVPESLCRKIAGLLLFPRANGKEVMSLKLAVRIMKNNGEGVADPETGEIIMPSVETISRAMRLPPGSAQKGQAHRARPFPASQPCVAVGRLGLHPVPHTRGKARRHHG